MAGQFSSLSTLVSTFDETAMTYIFPKICTKF